MNRTAYGEGRRERSGKPLGGGAIPGLPAAIRAKPATAWSRGAGAEPPNRERSDQEARKPIGGGESPRPAGRWCAGCGARRPPPAVRLLAHKGGRSPPTAGGVGRRTSDSRREPRRGLGGAARVAAPSAAWARNLAPPPEPGGRRGSPLFWLSVRRRHKGPGVARGAAVLARGRRFQHLGIVGAGRAGSGHGSGLLAVLRWRSRR